MILNYDLIKQAILRKGFKFLEGELVLNLVGIRNVKDLNSNSFNDVFCIAYEDQGSKILKQFACTTDPGIYYRNNPENINGTAILVYGQHLNMWALGYHQGKYRALTQKSAVKVYRDRNKDSFLDFENINTGLFGINCHKAGENSKIVDKWSAGCQVIASSADFNLLLELAEKSALLHGNSFNYTLLSSAEFK